MTETSLVAGSSVLAAGGGVTGLTPRLRRRLPDRLPPSLSRPESSSPPLDSLRRERRTWKRYWISDGPRKEYIFLQLGRYSNMHVASTIIFLQTIPRKYYSTTERATIQRCLDWYRRYSSNHYDYDILIITHSTVT